MKVLLFFLLSFVAFATPTFSQDPLDPFSPQQALHGTQDAVPEIDPEEDKNKSVDELIDEAGRLLEQEERPLDARTKLLTALNKAPNDYRPYMLLCGYYMEVVGHFKLSLKYAKRALQLFDASNGKPPYENLVSAYQHGHLLYLLSQARLNLDDYQGALDALDEYSSHGYYRDWYAGSRAWILMKLGRLEEAISVSRMGILAGSEPGRIFNMLGILLSMTGKRNESIDMLERATRWEMSLGREGRPATPLNNVGEVYDEIFEENEAEASWLKATSSHDGCEHVLPALNLALLYLDQNRPQEAKRAMDNFESCVAQYPLRNGEEHRALVHLARGRIALKTGNINEALSHLEATLERRQWFGKIGTSLEDLQTSASISLAQALRARNNHLAGTLFSSLTDRLSAMKDRITGELRAAWLMRRARQILSEDLKNFEDLYIRNTDSMLEYPTLGELLATFPLKIARRRIEHEVSRDDRPLARAYYDSYLAESLLKNGKRREGYERIDKILPALRDGIDEDLKIHLLTLKLENYQERSAEYAELAERIFALSRPALRNAGFRLPVNYQRVSGLDALATLDASAFYPDNTSSHTYRITSEDEAKVHVYKFARTDMGSSEVTVRADEPADAVNRLAQEVYTRDLQ